MSYCFRTLQTLQQKDKGQKILDHLLITVDLQQIIWKIYSIMRYSIIIQPNWKLGKTLHLCLSDTNDMINLGFRDVWESN